MKITFSTSSTWLVYEITYDGVTVTSKPHALDEEHSLDSLISTLKGVQKALKALSDGKA